VARNPRERVLQALTAWVPLALGIGATTLLVYLAVQQSHRTRADDPQIQMAEDAAASLGVGRLAASYDVAEKVDVAASLSPWLVVYDENVRPVAWSGQLDGLPPVLPRGVYEHVRSAGEARVTWQPRPGVRMATVVTRVSGKRPGFVAAGRSLRETEKRVAALTTVCGLAVAVTLLVTLVASLLLAWLGLWPVDTGRGRG
jgi:hypothetical protein